MTKKNKDKKLAEKWQNEVINLYHQNQQYLDKAVFTTAVAAIPLMLAYSEKLIENNIIIIFWAASLISLMAVIILHIVGLSSARTGCELLTEDEQSEIDRGSKKCLRAKNIDKWRDWIFVFSIMFICISIIINVYSKKIAKKFITENIQQNSKLKTNLVSNFKTPAKSQLKQLSTKTNK